MLISIKANKTERALFCVLFMNLILTLVCLVLLFLFLFGQKYIMLIEYVLIVISGVFAVFEFVLSVK